MKNYKSVLSITVMFGLANLSWLSFSAHASAKDACEDVSRVTKNVTTSTCFQYVKGFLDGASLSDKQIMKNIGAKEDELSAFSERALRTRVGITRGEVPATLLAEFCLPNSAATDDVVLKVLQALKNVKIKSDIDEEMVYENIKRIFPCSK